MILVLAITQACLPDSADDLVYQIEDSMKKRIGKLKQPAKKRNIVISSLLNTQFEKKEIEIKSYF